jgi:biotin carboxylase
LINKKLLVIGAGLAQFDAIRKAADMGYYVLASDGSPDAPGLKIASEARVIDVKDIKGNLQWARDAKIDGVVSYASDITLPAVLSVREALGLPGLGRIPMETSLDKSRQRKIFKENRLPQPDFEIIENEHSLKDTVKRIGFPLVIKPVDNSGSRGVTMVEKPEQLLPAYFTARANSAKNAVIIEEFIEGTELTVEGFSVNGTHHILAISDKFKPEGSYRVAIQLTYPAAISFEQEREIVDLMRAAYDAAEVDNTPTHSEIILTSKGPKIVEIGCRGGGFFVFTKVVGAVSGYDIVANWTRLCADDSVDEIKIAKRGVVLGFYAAAPGRLVSVKGLQEAQAMEGVETGLFIKPGEVVPELKTDGSRTGWMVVCGRDRTQAVERADIVRETVQFETVPL